MKEKGKVYVCPLAQISMDESSNIDFDAMNKDVYPFILWGLDWIFSKQIRGFYNIKKEGYNA